MLKTYFYTVVLIILFTIVSVSFTQVNNFEISGHVLDNYEKPLSGVNIFISGTTWGTHTNNNGYYKISGVKPGKYELVISIIGYEVTTKNISITENSITNMDFKIKQKSYELNPVEVISEKPKEWQKNLETFRNLFLGSTEYADNCIIENEIKIDFKKKDEDILSASVDEPLIIDNQSLGYRIYCVLLSFIWNMSERRIRFQVKPRFEELTPSSEEEKYSWKKNREEVFEGSLIHFLRSIINNEFLNEGYTLYLSLLPTESKNTSKLEQIFSSKKLIKQGIIADEFIFRFPNYLRVVHNGNLSWLKLSYSEVTIDKYGNPEEPVPFETYGYWAKSGMADMLPYNYVPDDK